MHALASAKPATTWALALGLAAAFASGCAGWKQYVGNGWKVGPNYCPPKASSSDHWIDASNPLVTETPPNDAWWRVFEDPTLDNLVAEARTRNPDLQAAGWRIAEARAQRGVTAGGLFPQTQQAVAGYSRNEVSQTVADVVHPQRAYSRWDVGGELAWELDFWGRFRRTIEAADAEVGASEENYRGVLVLLLAEVAANYIEVRTLDQRLGYLHHNVEIQAGSLDIARQRFSQGIGTELDVSQAKANLSQTEARIPTLEIARRQAANALCILLGRLPEDVDALLGGSRPIPSAPPLVAVGIPASLLERRPDVRQAERTMAAQCAKIGVAVSETYPHVSILGTVGFAASDFPDLFSGRSFVGSVGPSFRWNILNYGRVRSAVGVEEARFQQLTLHYQRAVLNAHREAENALVAFLKSQRRVRLLMESTRAVERSVELVKEQYRAGLADFNRVYTLERELTDQKDQLAVAAGEVAGNLVLLYKALGGGWDIAGEPAGCPLPSPSSSPAASATSAPSSPASTPKVIRLPLPEPEPVPAPNPWPSDTATDPGPAATAAPAQEPRDTSR